MSGNQETAVQGAKAPEIDRMAVKISHLDTLLALTGEIIIAASNLSILQRHISTLPPGQTDKDTADMVKIATMSTSRISSDLHHLVMDIRMVPIKETFLRFRRLVRDIAKKRGRQVNFEIVGEDTLVDKTVAERLYEPLAHQIRNAIDHGLEGPLERQHAGKKPAGDLVLSAYKKEGFTYVSVRDDGQGLDESRIRQTAVEKGFLSPDAVRTASREEIWQLITLPGFSTAKEATEISGRGVGMDVVKSVVEEMAGEVIIETEPGKGSCFTYKIPQLSAVNITDAVVIRAGKNYYAVPVGNVVATQAIKASDINTTMGRSRNIMYLDSILPLHDLQYLLAGVPLHEEEGDSIPVIIIEAKNGRIACKVTEFIRPQKLVLIPIPEGFEANGISGTTILGGNQLGMIIEPFELIAMANGTPLDADSAYASRSSALLSDEGAGEAVFPLEGEPDKAAAAPSPASAQTETAAPPAGVDQEVAEEFFIEIQNILKELNEDIFQLEKEPGSVSRVNTIFRHFHSIKGNFIMTGFNSVGAFVHKVETVLDMIREKTLDVSQDIIDLLLDAVKNLEAGMKIIRAGKRYEVEDKELLQQLDRYRRNQTMEKERYSEDDGGTFRFSPLGTLLFHAKMADPAQNVYQSMLKLKPSFQDPALLAYLIVKRLTMVGDIIDSVPALERIERGVIGDSLKVMFSSRRGLDEINRFFERQLVRLYPVAMFENLIME